MDINKKLNYIFCIFLMISSSVVTLAQQEKGSARLKRESRTLLREGNELYQKGEYTDAGVFYKKALKVNSTNRKASYNLGNAFYQQGNYKEAIPQYELIAEMSGDKDTKADALHNLGNAMLEDKQYQQAVDAFRSSLRNNPKDNETRYNLAIAQKELKKQKEREKKSGKNKKGDKEGKNGGKGDSKGKGEGGDKNKRYRNKDTNRKKEKLKPIQGKISPKQIKQLLESLKNEENKTRKKVNVKKGKGKRVKQEKDW